MSGIKRTDIKAAQDEHVFILVETEERPPISLDLTDIHGRRGLSVRVNGMTILSLLVDVKELPPMDERGAFKRFCPYCGEEFNLFSSKSHICAEDK